MSQSLLEEHLRQLEKVLSDQLRPLSSPIDDGESEAQLVREAASFSNHLDALEPHLQVVEPEGAGELHQRLRSLRTRARDLVTTSGEPAEEMPRPVPIAATRSIGLSEAVTFGARKSSVPTNDNCGSALAIGNGTFEGDLTMATVDGQSSCNVLPDVWFRYIAPADGPVTAYLTDEALRSALSVHALCPGSPVNEITYSCSKHFVRFEATAGSEVLIRVASRDEFGGAPFTLNVAPAARISGVVTDADSGDPLSADVRVRTRTSSSRVGFATTDATGAYDVAVGPPGTYFVRAGAVGYLGKDFDDGTCEADCPIGTPIELSVGTVVEGIDFALERLGSISGRVVDATTGQPISSVLVKIQDPTDRVVGFTTTDGTGDYDVGHLISGTYFAIASTPDYQDELYDDIPCLDPGSSDCEPATGTPIAVELNAETTEIDFALDPLGGIAGKVVHAASGEPLPLVTVALRDASGSSVGSGMTDAAGDYSISGVNPGVYYARTVNFAGFVDRLYDGVVCPRTIGCDDMEGAAIAVELNAVTSGIDFALDFGGRVEGTVTAALTGAPLELVSLSIKTADERTVAFSSADVAGRYSLGGLAAGTYSVTASMYPYVAEVFDDMPCPDEVFNCDVSMATPVTVAVESATQNIDFVLDRRGSITGLVTDLATGEPLVFAVIRIWNEAGGRHAFTQPGSPPGQYEVVGLNPGSYFITAENNQHEAELHDGLPCPGGPPQGCDVTTGAPVEIELNTTATVDFALPRRPMGALSGTLRTSTGEPIGNGRIRIEDTEGNQVGSRSVEADGSYRASELTPGSYFVIASADGFIGELYDDIPCRFGTCDSNGGTPVQVTDGSTTSGIDFALTQLGVISGTVRDSLIGGPVLDSSVRLWDANGTSAGSDSGSGFRFDELDPGTYFLSTLGSEGFREELYDDLPCTLGICDPTAGTPITVELDSPRSGIEFLLDLEQGITGRVINEESGQPIPTVIIDVWTVSGEYVKTVLTGPTGEYLVGLPIGNYVLATGLSVSPFDGFDEVYDDIPCPRGLCNPSATGTPVPVTGGAVTRNIDFALTPDLEDCVPTATAACLADDRFRVEVAWENAAGDQGAGQAAELTEATGTFWFFGPENIEVVVKVLDACVDPYNHFWVFAAGLTDVAAEVTVTDTLSGEVQVYSNPLGTAFAPIQDTAAFATCPVAGSGSAPPPGVETLTREIQRQLEQAADTWVVPTPPRSGTRAGSCVPTATSLCLDDGRFRAESQWRTTDGATGPGQAVELSDATGYFWFFSEDNVEALVKVLNACQLDGFNNFWVFAAGLTDLEVTLTVTDTESGEVQIYQNPPSTPFRPIQDTAAFDTCTEEPN